MIRFSLQILSETSSIPRTTGRDVIKNVYGSSRKVPLSLSDFIETFSTDLKKKNSDFKKIRPVGRKNTIGNCRDCYMVHSVTFRHSNRSMKPTDLSSFHPTCCNRTIQRYVTLWFIVLRHPLHRILSHENRRSWITVNAVCYRHAIPESYTVASWFETRQGHGYRLSL